MIALRAARRDPPPLLRRALADRHHRRRPRRPPRHRPPRAQPRSRHPPRSADPPQRARSLQGVHRRDARAVPAPARHAPLRHAARPRLPRLRRPGPALRPHRPARGAAPRPTSGSTPSPGEQAQVDWGNFGADPDRPRPRASCRASSSCSPGRAPSTPASPSTRRWRASCAATSRPSPRWAGVPRTLLYDNLKSVVLERVGEHIRFHPRLLELAGHYHFAPQPCAVARGNEKGRVERMIQYLRHAFFAARRFTSVEDLNAQLAQWIADTAHQRPVPGDPTGRRVADALDEERPRLLPLPGAPLRLRPRPRRGLRQDAVPPLRRQRLLDPAHPDSAARSPSWPPNTRSGSSTAPPRSPATPGATTAVSGSRPRPTSPRSPRPSAAPTTFAAAIASARPAPTPTPSSTPSPAAANSSPATRRPCSASSTSTTPGTSTRPSPTPWPATPSAPGPSRISSTSAPAPGAPRRPSPCCCPPTPASGISASRPIASPTTTASSRTPARPEDPDGPTP